ARLRAAAATEWHIVAAAESGDEVNAWDLAHGVVSNGQGFGVAGGAAEFAEPDLEQQWVFGSEPQHAFAMTRTCDGPEDPFPDLPQGQGHYWFRDQSHSQLENARDQVGQPKKNLVRIAHFDTGFDPQHVTLPSGLIKELQKNFVDGGNPDDATDRSHG